MDISMREIEHERRDWVIVVGIILLGLLCVFIVGGWALSFAPRWHINADMRSTLDPNSDYLTNLPNRPIEAIDIDPSILTEPVWLHVFQTAGVPIPTRIHLTNTPAALPTSTRVPGTSTSTNVPMKTATSTLVYFPPTSTKTSKPVFTKTPVPTAISTGTWTATSTETATGTGTATSTATATATETATFTSVPPQADLQIQNFTDNATDYAANASVQYTFTASNPSGPADVIGATITSSFSANLDSANITWACTSGANGNGNINTTLDLPVGSSVTCTVNATVISSPSGALSSSVTIDPPTGITDLKTGNNIATDSDTLITVDAPPSEIGPTPDGNAYNFPGGSTLTLSINLVANGDSNPDLVYYERPAGSGIWLDWIVIEISDGHNWYQIFYWGDELRDQNTDVDFKNLPGYPQTPEEPDQRDIPSTSLYPYPGTGVAIDIDAIVPPGNYSYIRLYAPTGPGDVDGQAEVDAIQVLP